MARHCKCNFLVQRTNDIMRHFDKIKRRKDFWLIQRIQIRHLISVLQFTLCHFRFYQICFNCCCSLKHLDSTGGFCIVMVSCCRISFLGVLCSPVPPLPPDCSCLINQLEVSGCSSTGCPHRPKSMRTE